jgi:ribosome maturation factor RimP
MWKLHQAIAWIVIVCVFCPTLEAQDVVDMQRRVAELGQGAEIKLKLGDGSRRRGQVERIETEGFDLRESRESPARRIEYGQIASLELARRVYRSDGGPDPVAAHRVAVALGPGHHVLTRVRSGETYRGHIEKIDLQEFTIQLDRTRQLVVIPYAQIDHLEQNLSRAAKIAIAAAAIGVGVLVVIYLRIVTDPNY